MLPCSVIKEAIAPHLGALPYFLIKFHPYIALAGAKPLGNSNSLLTNFVVFTLIQIDGKSKRAVSTM